MKPLSTQQRPTMYFVGVSTGQSAIQQIFPEWAAILGLADAQLVGVDLPLQAPASDYQRLVRHIKDDPLSLGALVTSHKLDLVAAAGDLIDEMDQYAQLTCEVSCLFMRDGRLHGHAKDALTIGQALERICPENHWRASRASLLCLGAGGAAAALLSYLMLHEPPQSRPQPMIFVDIEADRLAHLRGIAHQLGAGQDIFRTYQHTSPEQNDTLVSDLPNGSLVINATGMGKDRPGSPITDNAVFPRAGTAWDLNYRGERQFLAQAEAQRDAQSMTIADGWHYFIQGWALIIGEIFQVEISEAAFEKLAVSANNFRSRMSYSS